MLNRRRFLQTSISAAAASSITAWAMRTPVKIAHREGNMPKKQGVSCYEMGASIPGISGIEVATVSSKLWEKENALAYKREADRWRMRTVSMGGMFPRDVTMLTIGPAEDAIRKTIQSGEILGATVVLIGGFFNTCPKMDDESSYAPVVQLLQKMGAVAQDAGMDLGLELSLNVEEYQKLIKLVGNPAVRPYWDATGTDHMGHPGDGIRGLEVLGGSICQMHLKNGRAGFLINDERHLLEKHPQSPLPDRVMSIDWPKAFSIIKTNGFEGWFAFETAHASYESCIEDTTKNVQYVMKALA